MRMKWTINNFNSMNNSKFVFIMKTISTKQIADLREKLSDQ